MGGREREEGEREMERKLLLTLCIFNINVIKAASPGSLRGRRETGRAWRERNWGVHRGGGSEEEASTPHLLGGVWDVEGASG